MATTSHKVGKCEASVVNTYVCDRPAGVRRFMLACSVLAWWVGLLGNSLLAETLTKQVEIEARIVEISRNTARELGVDMHLADVLGKLPTAASNLASPQTSAFGLGAAPSAETIGTRLFPTTGSPGTLNPSAILTDPQLKAILDQLGHEKGAKVFSTPMLLTPNSQVTKIQIGSSIPFVQSGLAIELVPRIGPDGTSIEMMITTRKPDVQEVANTTTVASDQTLVMGGIILPEKNRPKENVIVFITPQIVDVLSHLGAGSKPDQVKVETVGTGETIGHIADLKIQNLTGDGLHFFVPPLILESRDRKGQDYICPEEERVEIAAGQTATVPMNGVCINRDKPPIANGVSGGLVVNTVDPGLAQHSDCHIPAKGAGDLLRICRSVYQAVDDLQKDGSLKDFPYKDKKEQQEILEQWGVWTNPEISEISKTPPATKDDLKKVVYKQVEEKGTPSTDTKKKVDKGIDTIFEKIELTTKKAKDLEKTDSPAQTKSPEQT